MYMYMYIHIIILYMYMYVHHHSNVGCKNYTHTKHACTRTMHLVHMSCLNSLFVSFFCALQSSTYVSYMYCT